jgi:hypothetical protein
MDITPEDVKVCNCCGKQVVEGDIRGIEITQSWSEREKDLTTFTMQSSTFWICEECETEVRASIGSKGSVDNFISDMAQGFDIYAMESYGNALGNFKTLAKIWINYGINAPE